MTKTDLINKLIEITIRIGNKYYIPYNEALDLISELETRPIVIKND